ncbi:MAG: helix-turn-helix domain-containing protein [Rhizobiaceae bacterium]
MSNVRKIMSLKRKKHETGCPIAHGLDVFGDRWTLLILRDMMLHGKKTYGEFQSSPEQIATNVLADRLKHLEVEGVVEKQRDPENRRSFIYTLTESGLSLVPVIAEIIRWSGKLMPLDSRRKKLVKRIESDLEGFVKEVRSR